MVLDKREILSSVIFSNTIEEITRSLPRKQKNKVNEGYMIYLA